MLLEIVNRLSPETNRKSVAYRLQCEACGKVNEGSKCRYERSVMHFCDNKCRGRYKHEHPETWKVAIEALNSPASHAKSTATIREKAAKGEWRHWLGKHHSEETKQHLSEVSKGGKRSGSNNGMFGRHHTEGAKEKMSEAKTRLILEGKFRAYGTHNKKGWYTSTKTGKECFFRSSWEEAMMKWLDQNDDVVTWDYESLRIPYYYYKEGCQRWYVPDFLVTRGDGSRQLLEIKPKEFIDCERVRLKCEAGEIWCRENDVQMIMVTRDVMKQWNVACK